MTNGGGRWMGHNLKNAAPYDENITLLASAARTTSGTQVIKGVAPFSSAVFTRTITAKGVEADDTLNVYIQRELPNGDWEDFVSFTQALGNGTDADVDRADVYAGASAGTYGAAPPDGALAAGTVVDLMWGNSIRVKWVIVGTAVAATGTYTLAANVANADTVTIGSKTYTFQTTLTNVDGNVLIGASASASIDNLIAAINLGAGSGTLYAAATTLHPTVSAAAGAGDTMTATAKTAGAAGNSIATTEVGANSSWGAATLEGGSDTGTFTFSVEGSFRV